VGNVVLCRVIRITPRQAVVAILVCGETVLEAEWQGLIRVQDVRATEKDRVKIYESFRPGDVVRAEVVSLSLSFFLCFVRLWVWGSLLTGLDTQISLGDQANYYLSTARNELGVVLATSETGNTMQPVSWKELRDPETGVTELRKVAQPQPQ
jgi:exosome complex component CSL4